MKLRTLTENFAKMSSKSQKDAVTKSKLVVAAKKEEVKTAKEAT